ncbi:tRNA (adenosine(37)-N6)-dimethylallyltransferase MiaA [Shewanella atlantica]|uniref:tRNA dimethylallyltransferase n=1 Tax=Shewanella atlantica TaxID=271099 RepID=A0A431W2T0_9GAMM|nr:tRNA (adenosine(37)-N6)-dimethylallyltransferase MiaA [Shewanella atlantica]RTR29756.1 tRNA (adenosine(37)-N6)-dimethylallyltransferase MiaA [Shewanella atlantica]
MKNFNLILVIGATASGKTRLGVELARQLKGEIISADSRQVYKGLDIGSGKDLAEYGEVPHHLIDIVEPGHEYNAFQFQNDFFEAFTDIQSRNKQPILVGGTGLYVDAVVSGYEFVQLDKDLALRAELDLQPLEQVQKLLLELDAVQYEKTDLTVRPRLYRAIEIAKSKQVDPKPPKALPEIRPLYFGIQWDRKVLRKRIKTRLKERFEQGMVEEVQGLLDKGVSHEQLEYYGLEYRFVSQYIAGQISYEDMFDRLNIAIGQYAKRQETWFRRIERHGGKIHWLQGSGDIHQQACEVLAELNQT